MAHDSPASSYHHVFTPPDFWTSASIGALPGGPPSREHPPPVPHNLPVPSTRLIGREHEVMAVSRRLGACRLLTLVGVGGVGKTRVALAVAAALLAEPSDGVWLVALAPLTASTAVTVGGAREQPSTALPASPAAAAVVAAAAAAGTASEAIQEATGW